MTYAALDHEKRKAAECLCRTAHDRGHGRFGFALWDLGAYLLTGRPHWLRP